MSAYRDAAARFADAGARVLGATIDSPERARRFAEKLALPFPILGDRDGALARAYGVEKDGRAQRATFVIGRDGRVQRVIEGTEALDPAVALAACGLPR